ncbi:MAG: hypothetical protein AAGF07_04335 [Patescibacteria group bacterium]
MDNKKVLAKLEKRVDCTFSKSETEVVLFLISNGRCDQNEISMHCNTSNENIRRRLSYIYEKCKIEGEGLKMPKLLKLIDESKGFKKTPILDIRKRIESEGYIKAVKYLPTTIQEMAMLSKENNIKDYLEAVLFVLEQMR